MTYFKTALMTSTIALLATGCASTLDDSQKIGISDNDKYSTSGGDDMDNLDARYKVGEDDGDSYDARIGEARGSMSDTDNMSNSNSMSSSNNMMSDSTMVGGSAMYSNRTIVENASNASNLTTLVAAVKQADLVETLSSDGPFTVFAPTNTAFDMVGGNTVSNLMMDSNKGDLQKVLKAHVVSGKIDAATLMNKIKMSGGSYTAETVSGDTLTFYVMNDEVKVADESGRLATVTQADVMQSNGIVHVVNSVLIPK